MKINNYSNTKITTFLFILAIIVVLLVLSIVAFGQKTAYLVSYDSANVLIVKKVAEIDSVELLMKQNLARLRDGKEVYISLYAEKKRVAKNGKLKRIRK